jgi:molybdenum cofactor cytidylyltransferase
MNRWNDIACIVLAAGGSSRFGSPKQLQLVGGRTLVHRAVSAAFETGIETVVLVAGSSYEEITAAVSDFESLIVAHNPDWRSGLSSSLRAGLLALESHTPFDGVLITVGDQPRVDGHSLRKLLSVFDRDHRIVASSYSGIRGVPALIGNEYLDDLMHLEGDHGAGQWLRTHPDRLTLVDMPEASMDIDTRDDLAMFRGIPPT